LKIDEGLKRVIDVFIRTKKFTDLSEVEEISPQEEEIWSE
jgi:hypothetical protein